MTKNELKEQLEKALASSELDTEMFSMLQDASIHAALILGIELQLASDAYATQCIGHIVMTDVLGFGQDISLEDLLRPKPVNQRKPITEQERAKLDAITPKDLNLDL